jgi:hypothetical protein
MTTAIANKVLSFDEFKNKYAHLIGVFLEEVSPYGAVANYYGEFVIEDDGDMYAIHDNEGTVLLCYDYGEDVTKRFSYGVRSYAHFNMSRWAEHYSQE